MASSADENIPEEEPVRRTRSGRAVKSTTPKSTRKTKKKTIIVEVEVSEEEEDSKLERDIDSDLNTTNEENNIDETDAKPISNNRSESSPSVEDSQTVSNNLEDKSLEIKSISQSDLEVNDSNLCKQSEERKNEEPTVVNESNDIEKMEVDDSQEQFTYNDDKENIDTEEMEVDCSKKLSKENSSDELEKSSLKKVESNKEDANPDTEVISEDELPTVQAVKVPETEEVSDDELPGPKLAELPADTEVVSEDELPTVKREGVKRKLESSEYDPGSPTSETDVVAAKRATVTPIPDVEKKDMETLEKSEKNDKDKTSADKNAVAKDSKSKLPELDKYWKAVNDDPADFTGWTYLLQYVDQVNDIEAAREAYDAFLSHYPYCYGYWRKYADYEKRKGNKKKCEEVFERGLKAIPLSVDLWLHFLNYTKVTYAENEDHIREQFERALTACGLEFRSDRLWDTYIKWEAEGKRLQKVTAIYDRLLATPTQGYTTHFDNFQEHVATHLPNKILMIDEFLLIRKEVRQLLKHEETPAENSDVPPGEDDANDDTLKSDEETKALKERIVSIRRKIHKSTVAAVTTRWNFEEGIKRPYFHVKPLERCQLKNWKEYLDFEIEQNDCQRIMVLFERCLIACALYEEFWLRYVKYLEEQKDETLQSKIREVYERACTVHHVGKPSLHLAWAVYEEASNNLTKASEILVNLEKSVPNLLQVAYRRINLERRRGDLEKCAQLYEYYINNSKNKMIATNMAIKFARFSYKVCNEFDKAIEILKNAVTKDPTNPRLYLQLIDLGLQRETIDEKEILDYINQFLEKDGNESEQKVLFAQRKLEFLEDFGSTIESVQQAYEEYQKYCKLNKEKKKKEEAKGDLKKSKTESQPPLPSQNSSAYSSYGSYGSGANQNSNNYSQYNNQSGYGSQYSGQYPQSSDQYQYQNWQYSQTGYGGYNQWSGYGNYYQ